MLFTGNEPFRKPGVTFKVLTETVESWITSESVLYRDRGLKILFNATYIRRTYLERNRRETGRE